jgi:hypothetical protein
MGLLAATRGNAAAHEKNPAIKLKYLIYRV